MEYLNLHASILDSPAVVGAEPIDRATWLMLLRYCIGQENGGAIAACRPWKDRKWQQLARVSLSEVNRSSDLWTWQGEDLHVLHYPVSQEAAVRAKRDIARSNGRRGGRPKENPAETNVGFPLVPESEPNPNPCEKRNGREGKEREGTTVQSAGEEPQIPAPKAAEALVAAYVRNAATRPAIEAATDCLRRHHTKLDPAMADAILAGTRLATTCMRAWPPDELLAYGPSAETFFSNDLWRRTADDWTSRREAKKRLAPTTTGGKPALTEQERAARLGGRA
jgi:hypothetical protein